MRQISRSGKPSFSHTILNCAFFPINAANKNNEQPPHAHPRVWRGCSKTAGHPRKYILWTAPPRYSIHCSANEKLVLDFSFLKNNFQFPLFGNSLPFTQSHSISQNVLILFSFSNVLVRKWNANFVLLKKQPIYNKRIWLTNSNSVDNIAFIHR